MNENKITVVGFIDQNSCTRWLLNRANENKNQPGMEASVNILVVDDEPEIVAILKEWLTSRGYQALGTTDALQVPGLLRAKHFDVVLLDLMMPEANGLSLISQIRRLAPQTKVTVISGIADIRIAVEAARGGIEAYLTKPIDLGQLAQILQRIRVPAA